MPPSEPNAANEPSPTEQAGERFLRSMAAAGITRVPRPESRGAAAGEHDVAATLAAVAAEVTACQGCGLAATRTCAVPGEGNPAAHVVFVGEGPGADEDKSGRPFVGRAGKLLDDIITKGMGLAREDVFICNVVKCRPPGNRVPNPDEMDACGDYLERQLQAIAPKVICALGATAVRRLLDTDKPMSRLRGSVYEAYGIPVIPTYHPAYLLRNPPAKVAVWEDIQKVMKIAGVA